MILDTSFLIDYMEGLPEAIAKLKKIQEHKESLFVSTITLFELWSGISQCNQPEFEKQKVKRVIESQLVLDFTKECAEKAGMINGALLKRGMPIDPEDCMIGGIAEHYGEKVLTRNVRHFGKIKDIEIETY